MTWRVKQEGAEFVLQWQDRITGKWEYNCWKGTDEVTIYKTLAGAKRALKRRKERDCEIAAKRMAQEVLPI